MTETLHLSVTSSLVMTARGVHRVNQTETMSRPPRMLISCEAGMSSAPQRIQLRRSKGWRKPAGAVVVSRPSKWGNPWRVGDPHPDPDEGGRAIRDLAEAVALFELHAGPLGLYELDREELRRELCGRDLACWCRPSAACHANVLLRWANEAS